MRVTDFIYDSGATPPHVEAILDRLAERDDPVEVRDVGAADDREDAVREAILTVRGAVRVGKTPDALYDDEGNLDFSAGALITERETGRRTLHTGREALEALAPDEP